MDFAPALEEESAWENTWPQTDVEEVSRLSPSGKSGGTPPLQSPLVKEALPVVYNPNIPIETFDFIVIDECHRSIYNQWRQVLDYFDAFLIGLTATPTKQTIGFFNGNLVEEYGHEAAVADNVNVGFDVYTIETDITKNGVELKKKPGYFVPHRDRRTRKNVHKELDEDIQVTGTELDRSVVSKPQIRLVIQTFRDRLFTEIFPGREYVPKTLIFAKNDNHAEDIVKIVREEFGKGNDFCQKITSKTTGKKPKELIAEFRNSFNPRIAVTVDMIATGTDVKPLECLLFMRNINSWAYFEQMKGRGSRIIDPDRLRSVTPDARHKTRFVIVDAVGVCEGDKSASKPLDRKPSVSMKQILKQVSMGAIHPDVTSTLAARLTRIAARRKQAWLDEFEKVAGATIPEVANQLLKSTDPDRVEEASRLLLGEADPQQRRDAASTLDINFFDRSEPIAEGTGNLPHLTQEGVAYFVTFRLADSLPQSKLTQLKTERDAWLAKHPKPHDPPTQREYYQRFVDIVDKWLDAGSGECILNAPDVRQIVASAFHHFAGQRYLLGPFVIMPNHVHIIFAPIGEHQLHEVMHSWKSFTAKKINKLLARTGTIWQKESFDHIIRSPDEYENKARYIIDNPRYLQKDQYTLGIHVEEASRLLPNNPDLFKEATATYLVLSDESGGTPLLQQAEQNLMRDALRPFHNAPVRELLMRIEEQIIDESTPDRLISAGPNAQSQEKAQSLISDFRQFIEDHKDEIEAISILYSRPHSAGLRYSQIKDLARRLSIKPFHIDESQPQTLLRLWQAFGTVAPDKVDTGSGTHCKHIVDLVSLVRHAIDPESPLRPVGQTVDERFTEWLSDQQQTGGEFTEEQMQWLLAIKDHIASSLMIEQDDFEYAPFNQFGGIGRAYELFGDRLAEIMEELNARLAA